MDKIVKEFESQKSILLNLQYGKDDALIADLGCKCLKLLLKLYSKFKSPVIEENFVRLYLFVLGAPGIASFKEIQKLLSSTTLKPFAVQLKDAHYMLAADAMVDGGDRQTIEFHLKKALHFYPTEELWLALSQYYMVNNELGKALKTLKRYKGVESPKFFYQRLYCLNKLCDFKGLNQELPKLKALIDQGDDNCYVLFLKWLGFDNDTVFKATRNFQKKFEGKQDFKGRAKKGGKIRLGYIGSNFIPHTQSHQFGLTFFKEHGPNFELFIYSLRGDGTTETEMAFSKEVSRYVNCQNLEQEEIVQLIREDDLDILVNCNGHADDRRPYHLMCRRLAPIQIDYLGYPGTSGATYIDYYIGDPVSTPIDLLGPYFTEKLILLPHTYQITEHAEMYPDLPIEKLSHEEFVFCSLNHQVKLSLKDIECWNEILKRVKHSVLFLFLMFSDEPKEKLIKLFDRGVRKRLFFVRALPKRQHLNRLRGVDCVLDSFNYGSHTTAGDALWAQVPIVTCLGETMESRVCSSMLKAAGLEELIAKDPKSYIELAVRCATDQEFYQELKKKLIHSRESPLFDRQQYLKALTLGYEKAWERNSPDNIIIA